MTSAPTIPEKVTAAPASAEDSLAVILQKAKRDIEPLIHMLAATQPGEGTPALFSPAIVAIAQAIIILDDASKLEARITAVEAALQQLRLRRADGSAACKPQTPSPNLEA